jgi:hypothetical protein
MPDTGPAPPLDPATVLDALTRDPRLRVFLADGRIQVIPAKRSRRLALLDHIAQAFEPGVRYSERDVSSFLGILHPDYAALRRLLVDEEFLSRSGGQYWRTGGTVLPSPATPNGGVMTEQDPDRLPDPDLLPEDFHRSRREHPGKLERLDDDQLARLAEEERVDAGLDDYDPDEVPPATDEPPEPDIAQSEVFQEAQAEIRREYDKDELTLEHERSPYPPTRYE